MDPKYILASIGCICITVIASVATAAGHDGALLTAAMAGIGAIIGGTIGYEIGKTSK